MTTKPLLVLQHIACEPPAAYEDERRSIALARSLFSRWLERVVGVPAVALVQSPR